MTSLPTCTAITKAVSNSATTLYSTKDPSILKLIIILLDRRLRTTPLQLNLFLHRINLLIFSQNPLGGSSSKIARVNSTSAVTFPKLSLSGEGTTSSSNCPKKKLNTSQFPHPHFDQTPHFLCLKSPLGKQIIPSYRHGNCCLTLRLPILPKLALFAHGSPCS